MIINSHSTYMFDFEKDEPNGIVNLCGPEQYSAMYDKHVYVFGYKFNNNANRDERNDFIQYLKTVDLNSEIKRFITRPLVSLNEIIDFSKFDALIYPSSKMSPLTRFVAAYASRFISNGKQIIELELIKKNINEITFDFDKYFLANSNKYNSEKSKNEIINSINEMMKKIQTGEYFQIGTQKTKYRPFFRDFLVFKDESMGKFNKIENGKLLIIDNINTTGSTLDEIIRYVNAINCSNELYIFTLIGKDEFV